MKNLPIKKLTLVLVLAVLLSGCLGIGEDATTPPSGYHSYGVNDILVNIPDSWEVITPAEFFSGIPPETTIAFKSNLKNPTFTPNVTILTSGVAVDTKTMDYAKSLKHRIESSLVSYRDLGTENEVVTVTGAPVDTLLIKSEGSEGEQRDLKIFMHVAAVKNGVVYTAVGTALANADEAEIERLQNIVTSLQIK